MLLSVLTVSLNTIVSVVSNVWHKKEVCVNISCLKISNMNLEQIININFCLELGKGTSEMYALLSEACGTEAVKRSSVF